MSDTPLDQTPPNPSTPAAADRPAPESADGQQSAAVAVAEIPDHAAQPGYHRVLAPDLARGFMLLFIALANIPFYIHGFDSYVPPAGNAADAVTLFIQAMAINSRTFPMFAFLFGYGMVQFYQSRLDRGLSDKAVRVMLRRRHLGLLLLGVLHFVLLFQGDVLGAYGLTGLIIVALFFRRRDKTVLIWACIWYGLLLAMGIVGLIASLIWPSDAATFGENFAFEYISRPAQSSYFDGFSEQLLLLLISYPAQAILSPFAGMMMLGWLAARHRILENAAEHTVLLRNVAIVGIGVGWLAGIPAALTNSGLLTSSYTWLTSWQNMISPWLGSFAGVGYVALFGLLSVAWQNRPNRAVLAVANVGARSLSSYLLQSIVFAPLLSAWGLGLGHRLGAFPAALIAIGTWLLSVAICWWLAARGHRGPFEVALRRITYGAHR